MKKWRSATIAGACVPPGWWPTVVPLFEAIDETGVGYVVEECYDADGELPLRASTSDGSALPEPFPAIPRVHGSPLRARVTHLRRHDKLA